MSASNVVVAANAQLLRRLDLRPEVSAGAVRSAADDELPLLVAGFGGVKETTKH